MRKILFESLKTKFEGVSEITLSKLAAKLAKKATTEDEATALVDAYTWADLVSYEGDRRATEAAAKRGDEAEQPLRKGAAVEEPESKKSQVDSDTPEWAKAIMEANSRLSAELESIKAERIADGRKARYSEVIKGLPKTVQKAYLRTSLDGTDEEFETLLKDVSEEVAGVIQDTKQKGAVFGRPTAGGGVIADKLTDEQMKAVTARAGAADSDAQPF